jgi:hypothetical protein
MLHLAGMSQGAIALFLGTSNDVICAVLRMPKVQQYVTGLRATMTNDIRRIAAELNQTLENSANEALTAEIDIMRAAKNECLDPSNDDRRWEAGRLAVASAQDILSRTMPKPQPDQKVEHNHRHLHAKVPEGFLDAVRQLDTNGHTSSAIIDVTEPGTAIEIPLDTDDESVTSVEELISRSPE